MIGMSGCEVGETENVISLVLDVLSVRAWNRSHLKAELKPFCAIV